LAFTASDNRTEGHLKVIAGTLSSFENKWQYIGNGARKRLGYSYHRPLIKSSEALSINTVDDDDKTYCNDGGFS